jgi:hypothetical protein
MAINFRWLWQSVPEKEIKLRRRILEIVGSKKAAVVDCVAQQIKIYDDNKIDSVDVNLNNTIRDEISNFINTIKTRKNSFNAGIVGARNVEMIERAITSLR